ncbi:MAG TPA: DNA translocase FtsK, partial [Chloroflexota bacterium]|nr:DNA translocase FtsK [Chloroflexota bacterium]
MHSGRGSKRSSPSSRPGRSALQAFLRFSRPRGASETLILFLATLGVVSVLAGVYSSLAGSSAAAIYWGAFLLAASGVIRARGLRERFGWSLTITDARVAVGVFLVFVVLLYVTGDIISYAVGTDTVPLLGPLSAPWLAYPLLTLGFLIGVAGIAGRDRVARMLGFPLGFAVQTRVPSMTRVTRQTQIDQTNGSVTDVAEPEILDLLSTPVLSRSRKRDRTRSAQPPGPPARRSSGDAGLPPHGILQAAGAVATVPVDLDTKARTIEQKLATFGVGARVVAYHRGPTVTLFDVDPDPGVKVKRITELQNDLALALAAPTVRIQAPVPGRPVVGIEIPNTIATMVTMREILESESFHAIDSPLRVAVGKGVGGESVSIDLAAMPHLLIAGATGSGKSVMLNVIISSLLFQNTPEDVRLLMIDPKMVELTVYNGIPHLYSPVVTDMDKVLGVLRWTIREMERRYALFRDSSVRNLARYNQQLVESGQKKLPYIVVVVDELADLMMVAPDEVEDCVCRLAQLARATGIHLVIATQRPSVDVVTGLIKANFPARMAFAMSSQVDSRTILDQVGAEKLLGRGDMLYQSPTAPKPVRLQAALISDHEIERLVEFWREVPLHLEQVSMAEFERQAAAAPEHVDALFESAKAVVREYRRASV